MRSRELRGRVSGFDAVVGLGEVDGHGFHCVSIVDGRRQIEIGAPVRYRVGLRLGRPEALDVVDLSQPPSAD